MTTLVIAGALAGLAVATEQTPRSLVMSKTAGFRHQSIEAGVKALERLGKERGLAIDFTEDAAVFTKDKLARYDAVVFLNTTGDILERPQEAALETYIRKGGGFVGIHAATDTEYEWAWYGKLVGARFAGHGPVEPGTLEPADRKHPSTRHLPSPWTRSDEWYRFKDMVPDLHVLVRLKEPDGSARPVVWCHEFDGGRSWYTVGGHTKGNFAEPLFVEHLYGGITWATGRRDALGSR
jgi:type 1 glutamine amidotransferase